MSDSYVYRPLTGLTWLLVFLLSLGAVGGVANAISSGMQIELLNRSDFTKAEGEANDTREQILGLMSLGIYLVTVIFFGVWIVRANRNVRALGAKSLPIAPGWAVGYFFIPILNLFRPYQAMRDLLKASRNPAKWRAASGSPLLPLWWTLWLITNLVHQVGARILRGENGTLTSVREGTRVMMAAELLDIALCLAAIGVVLVIAKAQRTAIANSPAVAWPEEHWDRGVRDAEPTDGRSQDDDENFVFRPQ